MKITPPTPQGSSRSFAEWVTFSVALLILVITIGLVIYQMLTRQDEPPILSVNRSSEIRKVAGQFYVPFEVKNTGGQTVEAVQIIGELRVQGEVVETGEQQVNFLSSGESEAGAFVFSHDPGEGELVIRVASYKLP